MLKPHSMIQRKSTVSLGTVECSSYVFVEKYECESLI